MKKAIYNQDGSFMSAIRDDLETSLPYVLVDDETGFALTSRHFYINGEWVYVQAAPATNDHVWRPVRSRRNQLLTASDWTQLPDVPLATKEAWAAYRQALRDITLQPDPFNIVWPVPPGGAAGEPL